MHGYSIKFVNPAVPRENTLFIERVVNMSVSVCVCVCVCGSRTYFQIWFQNVG